MALWHRHRREARPDAIRCDLGAWLPTAAGNRSRTLPFYVKQRVNELSFLLHWYRLFLALLQVSIREVRENIFRWPKSFSEFRYANKFCLNLLLIRL